MRVPDQAEGRHLPGTLLQTISPNGGPHNPQFPLQAADRPDDPTRRVGHQALRQAQGDLPCRNRKRFDLLHILDDLRGEFGGADFRRARHLPLQIISDGLVVDRLLHAGVDQLRRLVPTHVFEHHHG